MEKNSLSKAEKILRGIFLCLAVIVIAGVLLLVRVQSTHPYMTENVVQQDETEEYSWEKGLSDVTYWLPEHCNLYDEIPDIVFDDEDGQTHSIREWKGKNVVLVFWAGWCEDCGRQMTNMSSYEKLAENYGEVSFLYINRTDGSRESAESAKEYFEPLSLNGELYFDVSLQAYDMLGIRNIPTTIFIDQEGIIKTWSAKQMEEASVFEALLKNAVEGASKSTADFITAGMMDEAGGIHSTYMPGTETDAETEVLSESQGLMLLYAVSIQDKELFDRIFGYVKTNMWKEGLSAWKVEDGKISDVNALIDDFRIYRALAEADDLWGEYAADLQACEEALTDKAADKEKYVDFYDFKSKQHADRFTLCYGDLKAMELLAERTDRPEAEKAYENALSLIERGQISNEFPLYYSWYNYEKERYEIDDLNTAEAMMTLLHLARQGKLKNNTIAWLKARMAGEGLKARYTVEGEVPEGYNYESTAIYAILVMIADEIGDKDLRAQALEKMEKMHITDLALEYNGAYGMEDGSGITSFDQLMPLLAWRKLEEPDTI